MKLSQDFRKFSDDELTKAFCADGDPMAFRELFDRFYTSLTLFANRFLADPDAASDVVQNVFITLYERRDSLNLSAVKSYLYSSVRNACLNVIKHEKIKQGYENDTLASSDEFDSDSADILIQQDEANAKIAAALNQLPDQCRRVFTMSRFDGLSNQEIADKLDISKRTVETQVSNALKTLRRLLLTCVAWLFSPFF